MLYIFGGLPGSGKSTLARHLARTLSAAYIRIDSIEEAIKEEQPFIGPEGYKAAYKLAEDNLANGLSVVADSVNPLEITRHAWREVAARANINYLEIEIICSCPEEHRKRIEHRGQGQIEKKTVTWENVPNREYQVWHSALVFDTVKESPKQSQNRFIREIQEKLGQKEEI